MVGIWNSTISNPNPPAAIGGGTAYSIGMNIPYVQPTDHTTLPLFYAITKRTKIWLAPGESHIHRIRTVYEKMYDGDLFTSPSAYFKGWHFGLALRCISTPIHGSTGGYDLGNGELIIYANLRLVGKAVVVSSQATSGQYTISSVMGVDQYVSQVTGLVESVATALNQEVV
jgi:hypothetical protein